MNSENAPGTPMGSRLKIVRIFIWNLCSELFESPKALADTIWKIVSMKWVFAAFGMSTKTVFARTILLFTLFSGSIYFGIFKPLKFQISDYAHFGRQDRVPAEGEPHTAEKIELIFKIIGICGGAVSVLYFALNKEFSEKYLHLATTYDRDLPEDKPITDASVIRALCGTKISEAKDSLGIRHLNFLEDCLIYHMEEHRSFSPTTQKTLGFLAVLNSKDRNLFHKLTEDHSEIQRYFSRWWSCESHMKSFLEKSVKKVQKS